jgi:hypothetical protein
MSEQYFRLRVAAGCDECNHSGYPKFVVRDGLVDVPFCAVEPLCRIGGAVLIGPTPNEVVVEAPSEEFVAEALHALLGAPPDAHHSAETVAQVVAAIEHRHVPALKLNILT